MLFLLVDPAWVSETLSLDTFVLHQDDEQEQTNDLHLDIPSAEIHLYSFLRSTIQVHDKRRSRVQGVLKIHQILNLLVHCRHSERTLYLFAWFFDGYRKVIPPLQLLTSFQ